MDHASRPSVKRGGPAAALAVLLCAAFWTAHLPTKATARKSCFPLIQSSRRRVKSILSSNRSDLPDESFRLHRARRFPKDEKKKNKKCRRQVVWFVYFNDQTWLIFGIIFLILDFKNISFYILNGFYKNFIRKKKKQNFLIFFRFFIVIL